MNLDELELELRKLPGIRWAAFSEFGDRLLVQLHAMHEARSDLGLEASRIAARHCELPIAVDVVRWLTPPGSERSDLESAALRSNGSPMAAIDAAEGEPGREPWLEMLAVVTVADEIEVHLSDGTTRTIGRAAMSRGLIGAAEATLEAIYGFTTEPPVKPEWARTIETTPDGRSLVAVALARPGRDGCYGLASAESPFEAAAHATVDALHRNMP